jgi:hypothetical protein
MSRIGRLRLTPYTFAGHDDMASPRSRVPVLAALVAVAGLFGCGDGGGGNGGGFEPEFDLAVVVEGTVLDSAEQPIFGVTIQITAYVWDGVCTTELVGPPVTTTVTEEGSFSRTVGFEGPTDNEIEACITVEALPPLGYFPDARSNIRTEIRPLDDGIDVVRVALVLEQNPL